MADPLCPICGGHDLEIRVIARQPTYYSCNRCGHHFIQQESANSKESFIEAQEHYYGDGSILLDEELTIVEWEVAKERYRVFKKFLPEKCDVIEVGPGGGHVLKWLAARGHRITGVEHSQTLSLQLSARLGVPIINAEFETHDFGATSFDTFCSFHVIEHVPNPLAHLNKAYEVVRPGGLAFLATPNARSWQQRVAPHLGPNFDSAHLHIFSPHSLQLACEQAGWKVIYKVTPESSGGWARVLSRILRTIRHEDAKHTAGKYGHSSSTSVKIFASLFRFATLPSRLLQKNLGAGNEIFMVLQKPSQIA